LTYGNGTLYLGNGNGNGNGARIKIGGIVIPNSCMSFRLIGTKLGDLDNSPNRMVISQKFGSFRADCVKVANTAAEM